MSKGKNKKAKKGWKVNVPNHESLDNPLAISKQKILSGLEDRIRFSFKYLKNVDGKFCIIDCEGDYFRTLIDRLKDLSTMKMLELLTSRSSALRAHPIDWSDVRVSEDKFDIPKEEQLVDTPYQISISGNESGRIHGFRIGDTFYVVWFDPNHLLYPGT